MTGFGQARASTNGISLHVECKSVNNRYLDLTLRLPSELQQKELALKEIVQEHVERGSLNLKVSIDKKETGKPDLAINENLARGYKKLLDKLRQTTKIDQPVTLKDLTQFDDIFRPRPEDEETIQLLWKLAQEAAHEALDKLNTMRCQEGQQLKNDLVKRVNHIESSTQKINDIIENRSEKIYQRLLTRIQNVIDSDKIDDERLEMEVAMLVDKMDITEEMVRLQSHVKFFLEALEAEKPVGRRLKFLSQEMNREINTMGSKANHSRVSQLVVEAKESLEQIREQILNIE